MKNKALEDKLIAFLETKDPKQGYAYCLAACCAAAQFNESIGREYPMSVAIGDRADGDCKTFDGQLENAAAEEPHNFGALLNRIRKFEDA